MKKICLVLGASGFIGKNLCAKLLSKGYSVRAYDRVDSEDLRNIGVQDIFVGDFTKTDDFTEMLKDVDLVYHLVSTTLPKGGSEHIIDEEINKNLIPTIKLLEDMKKFKAPKIVFASSAGTLYGDVLDNVANKESDLLKPICSYGLQKQLIENCLMFYKNAYNIDCRVARITNPYGIGQDKKRMQGVIPIFIDRLLNDQPITVFGKDSVRNYIYMDDVIDALVKIGEYNGVESVFNVGTENSYSIMEIIACKFSCFSLK